MQIKIVENQNEVYQKQKLLGQGAFGKAYLVKHKHTGQQLVIKQMNIQHMSSKQKQQTIKQAQILRNLCHPNIVNFREVYVTKNNKLKIVMQYAECGDLAKAIAARKSKKQYFQETQILDWFTQICLAIKHVHDRKILHRDIKGQNIFIAKNNSLKLGDFGIARVLNMTHDKARTVVGTPYYLSPQIIQNKPYSFKSDIWSIGAVLYQLCCLQPPFVANSLQMLALKIVKGNYSPIQGNFSKQLKALVAQMLTLDPNKRPSIHQILQKPVIQSRIRSFLSQTKQIAEFSHTILHNQKVQIFANKLVQIQKQKQVKNSNSKQKNLQVERQKLKEEQVRMEAIMVKKKQQQRRKQEQKRQDQIRRREEQIKRKEEEKRKRLIYQQQKKQQMQRDYEQNLRKAQQMKLKKQQQHRQYQRQMQMAALMRQKQQYEERKRKQTQNARKLNKKMQQDKKMQQFNDFAKKQYYENLQIRRRAQQRARREQEGYSELPKQNPKQNQSLIEKNYQYAQQNRPKTKQQSRNNSIQRKQNNSDFYNNNQAKKKDPQPTEQELINAFCNPDYIKGGPFKKQGNQISPGQKRSSVDISNQLKKQPISKYQQQRQKIKKDRQNYLKNKQRHENSEVKKQVPQFQAPEASKWVKKKSSQKRQQKQQTSAQKQSPRFQNQAQIIKQNQQQKQNQLQHIRFDSLIRDSQNLFLQAKDPAQFDKYIGELQQILQGVKEKIDLLPQIQLAQQIVFRDDDEFQLSLTVAPKKADELDTSGADLDYFSNYSKLQTLRIQLEQALGLDNFIRLYRFIEKQVNSRGLQGFNIDQAIRQVGGNIDSKIAHKNGTLLLTLVALEDKMSYT